MLRLPQAGWWAALLFPSVYLSPAVRSARAFADGHHAGPLAGATSTPLGRKSIDIFCSDPGASHRRLPANSAQTASGSSNADVRVESRRCNHVHTTGRRTAPRMEVADFWDRMDSPWDSLLEISPRSQWETTMPPSPQGVPRTAVWHYAGPP
jgi:hypothetical protein